MTIHLKGNARQRRTLRRRIVRELRSDEYLEECASADQKFPGQHHSNMTEGKRAQLFYLK